MRRYNLKYPLLLLAAILLGLLIHYSNPFMALIILMVWFLAAIFSFVVLLKGLVKKKFRLWYLIGFVPFLIGFSFESGIRNHRHDEAVKLNIQIEQYKIEHGQYPKNLLDLNSRISLSDLTYIPNSRLTNYRIEYYMDQFNREYFDSELNKWGTLGWND